jgi:hypothetical protein
MKPLLNAALHGDIARMKRLLAEGADINEVDTYNGCGVVCFAAWGRQFAALSWLFVEGGASINQVGNFANETVWAFIDPQSADAAELSSLLKVMVMLDDAPAHFVSRCSPYHAELCERGRQMRAHLPFYLGQQAGTIAATCPLPDVLERLVFAYAATTREDMWTDGLFSSTQ